jgi:hypothetical protein
MARIGKRVSIENPMYALDKNRGYLRIPSYGDNKNVEIVSLKFRNRWAYDQHAFKLVIDGKETILNKDELMEAIQYV